MKFKWEYKYQGLGGQKLWLRSEWWWKNLLTEMIKNANLCLKNSGPGYIKFKKVTSWGGTKETKMEEC